MAKNYGPYLEIARIQSEINRLFENLLQLRGDADPQQGFVPTADVYDDAERVVVEVELPGVALPDLTLLAHGPDLIVRGVKPRPDPASGATRHSLERVFGEFETVVSLTEPVNTHQAEAVFLEGLLRVGFPKVSNRRGESVDIPVREG